MRIVLDSFKNWKKFDYGLLIVALTTLIVIAVVKPQDHWLMTLVASSCSMTAGVLIYKGKQLGFAFYIVYSILYTIISLVNHMYGEAILYGIYALPMYVNSTVRWTREMKAAKEAGHSVNQEFLTIEKLDKKHAVIILGIGVAVTAGYGYVLSLMNSAVPYLNSLGTVCCATSIYMANKKYKEQWWAWLSYSLVFAAIWMSNMTLTFAAQSVVFVILNICGLVNWDKQYKEQVKNM